MVIAAAVAATTILTGVDVSSRASAEVPEMQPCIAQPELIEGSTGPGVLCLQFSLIMLGYSVPYSGTFDRATKDAVTYYQALHPPLVADGRAGQNTLASLGIDGAAPIYRTEAAPGAGATATSVAGVGGGVSFGVACGTRRSGTVGGSGAGGRRGCRPGSRRNTWEASRSGGRRGSPRGSRGGGCR